MDKVFTQKRPLFGRVRIFGLLFALLFTVLLGGTALAADVTRSGNTLQYEGQSYTALTNTQKQQLGISGEAYGTTHKEGSKEEFHVITLAEGGNSATHAVYAQTSPTTYKQQGNSTTVSVEEKPDGLESGTTCGVMGGLGWVICPLSNTLATGMDGLYGMLAGFLEVQPPVVGDQSTGLYQAWSIMRSFANVAFVIAFLVIIYSQITSIGVSAYGVKKMASRMLIAAILVNLSFVICAILIDISNISGYALQDIFIEIRKNVTSNGIATSSISTWEAAVSVILAGGGAAAGGALAFVATGGSITAAAMFVLPMLIGLFFSVIVALLVVAARQALVIILTIISPLAFACYLLPGTEKWFEKWRSTFFTMLIFFPAFSAVFGGSQLASAAIIQNANSMFVVILGLAVQVAPLAITPLILRLSGGLLNRFAGIINNPNKGMLDRAKNWSREQGAYLANKRSLSKNTDELKKRHFLRNAGRAINHVSQRRKERIQNYQSKADLAYEMTHGHKKQDRFRREIEQAKAITQKDLDINWNSYAQSNKRAVQQDLTLRLKSDQAKLGEEQLNVRYDELRAGHMHSDVAKYNSSAMNDMMKSAQSTSEQLVINGLRQANAQRVRNQQFAENMLQNEAMQQQAGGIYKYGAEASLASAIAAMNSEYGKSVQEGQMINERFGLSGDERQRYALGETVTKTIDVNGVKVSRTFDKNNLFTREAAIEEQMKVGTVEQVSQIVAESGSSLAEFKGTISKGLAQSGVKNKAPWLGGKLIDDIVKAEITSENDLIRYIQEWVAGNKFTAENIALTDPQGLNQLMKSLDQAAMVRQKSNETAAEYQQRVLATQQKLDNGIAKIKAAAETALQDPRLSSRVIEGSEDLLRKIQRGDFTV